MWRNAKINDAFRGETYTFLDKKHRGFLPDHFRQTTSELWQVTSRPMPWNHWLGVTIVKASPYKSHCLSGGILKKNAVKHHSLQEGQADSILSRRSLLCWKLTWERKAPPFLLTPRGSGLTGSGLVHLLSASQNNLEAIVRSKLIVWMQIGTGMA